MDTTKKKRITKAQMGDAVRLASLLHSYDPGAFRSLSGPANEALRIMSTPGEAQRMAQMIEVRIINARMLCDALHDLSRIEAQDLEVVK